MVKKSEYHNLFPGALELMILKTLSRNPSHGYALAQWTQQSSEDLVEIEEGSATRSPRSLWSRRLFRGAAYPRNRRSHALGAQCSSIVGLILGEAAHLVLLGLVFGIVASFFTGRLLRSPLFGVRSWDLSILMAVLETIAATPTAVATWWLRGFL